MHPSLEVVDAFRQVSDAFEEKHRLVNEAEGHKNEQLALARGNGSASIQNANAYSSGRKTRAEGDASRFQAAEQAFRGAQQATEFRLYLGTMEAVLPGEKKLILDKSQNKRDLSGCRMEWNCPTESVLCRSEDMQKKLVWGVRIIGVLLVYLSFYSV